MRTMLFSLDSAFLSLGNLCKYCIVLSMLFGSAHFVRAQENLIPNWSFEIVEPNFKGDTVYPGGGGQIGIAESWGAADGSPDYYHELSNVHHNPPNYGIPQNWGGWQEPYDGQAYASIGCFAEFFDDAKEYLWVELLDTLEQNHGYHFEMQLSLQDSENYAVGGLGAYFSSQDTRYWDDDDFFEVTPQVENPVDSLLYDKIRWMKVSGQFYAQGGEKFLTIGCFRRDVDDNILQISNNPSTNINWGVAVYYVDAVVLREDNSIGFGEHNEITISLYPNPATDVVSVELVDFSTGSSVQLTVTDMMGREILKLELFNKRETIDVSGWPSGIYVVKGTDEKGA